jgi:Flp pilus assembly protein TadD
MALAALSVIKDEEALQHFTRALEMDPRLSDASCGRGRALQRLGQWALAEIAYEKALDIDPENPEAQRSLLALRSRKLMNTIVSSLPRA